MSEPVITALPSDVDLLRAHLATQTDYLERLVRELAAPTPFTVRAWLDAGGGPKRLTASKALVRCLHNPTAAPLTVVLADGPFVELVVLTLTLAPNAALVVYLAFQGGVHLVAGSGAIVSGELLP